MYIKHINGNIKQSTNYNNDSTEISILKETANVIVLCAHCECGNGARPILLGVGSILLGATRNKRSSRRSENGREVEHREFLDGEVKTRAERPVMHPKR